MTLKADVYQLGGNRWYWVVYDTDRPMHPLAKGRAERDEWATALLDAQSALQRRLRLRAFQDRVNETVRKLAYIADYGVPRVVVSVDPPAPPALVWEGDYA